MANIVGMNLATAPDRLSGAGSFDDSPLIAYPLFLMECCSLLGVLKWPAAALP